MQLKVMQAVRNEHVFNMSIYPVHSSNADFAVGDFYAKYHYFPSYMYVLQHEPGYIYAVLDNQFTGDGDEDRMEQLYEVFSVPIENERNGLD